MRALFYATEFLVWVGQTALMLLLFPVMLAYRLVKGWHK